MFLMTFITQISCIFSVVRFSHVCFLSDCVCVEPSLEILLATAEELTMLFFYFILLPRSMPAQGDHFLSYYCYGMTKLIPKVVIPSLFYISVHIGLFFDYIHSRYTAALAASRRIFLG